jgi:hypothetical protein
VQKELPHVSRHNTRLSSTEVSREARGSVL